MRELTEKEGRMTQERGGVVMKGALKRTPVTGSTPLKQVLG